jgi:hypothetical protein
MKIKLIKVCNILDLNFYSGSMRVGDLIDNFQIPVYRAGSSSITAADSGYQREAKPIRVEQLSSRISTLQPGMTVPNKEAFVDTVNLNLRSSEAEKSYVKPLVPSEDGMGDFFEFDFIKDLGSFQVVDGQTRIKGAQRAYTNAKNDGNHELANDIADIRVQISLTFCEDVFKEAYEFYLINHYSKAIPPDGATRLLYEGKANQDVNFSNEVTRSRKGQEIESMTVAENLNLNSKVWAGNIRDFNEAAMGKMSIRAVAKMIQPFYKLVKENNTSGNQLNEDIVYEVVEAYWLGIKLAYPMMFKHGNSHLYNIMKAGPAEIMMKVLVKIYDLSLAGVKVGSMRDPKNFENHIKNVLDKHKERNGEGNNVSAENLFLVGKNGAMGQFSNGAAKEEASRRIRESLFTELGIKTP